MPPSRFLSFARCLSSDGAFHIKPSGVRQSGHSSIPAIRKDNKQCVAFFLHSCRISNTVLKSMVHSAHENRKALPTTPYRTAQWTQHSPRHPIGLHRGIRCCNGSAAANSPAREREIREADEYYRSADGYHSSAASETKLIDHYQHLRAASLCQPFVRQGLRSPPLCSCSTKKKRIIGHKIFWVMIEAQIS